MTALTACLAAGLGLALLALVLLALSRRRLVRLLAVEQAKSSARELAAKVALQERLAGDVAAIVAPLRALLEEQSRARAAFAANVASFRALVEWLASFAGAQHAQARASAERAQETVRRPERAPRGVPSIAPPGSAEVLPPEPAQVAAGLGPRPISRPLPARETPHPRPVRVGASARSRTLIGVAASVPSAPPDSGDSGDWIPDRPSDADGERTHVVPQPSPEALGVAPPRLPPRAVSPTLPSMSAPKANDSTGGDA